MATREEQEIALNKFHLWFETPYIILRDHGKGHAAFIALSIGLFLCERFFRSKTNTIDEHWRRDFLANAATHFGVDHGFFTEFWDVYRNGMQHQGSPKTTAKYGWDINGDYPSVPSKAVVSSKEIICLNPWGFTENLIALCKADPDFLAELGSHQLGDETLPKLSPALVPP